MNYILSDSNFHNIDVVQAEAFFRETLKLGPADTTMYYSFSVAVSTPQVTDTVYCPRH